MYHRLTCYYLSGTGNSYRAAQWLAEATAERGIAVSLIPISQAQPREDIQAGSSQLVGIYHPSHGLMPPWSMIKFLVRMPWGRGAHAVIGATRGGIRLGSLVFPGGSGLALFFPVLVLLLKGYRVRGGLSFDMPVNIINLHWGLHPKNVDHILAWGQHRHRKLIEAVLAGRRYWHPVNILWELLWVVPFVLWPLAPFGYLLVGRVFMAKLMFADPDCNGCGSCARHCPSQAIAMVGGRRRAGDRRQSDDRQHAGNRRRAGGQFPTPFWTHRCEVCLRCMGYCKPQAVQASHLWMIVVLFGTSLISAELIQRQVTELTGWHLFLVSSGASVFTWELIELLVVFASLSLAYYLFWGLQRIRLFKLLFTYTTLTKLWSRRYHAPGTTAREMTHRSEDVHAEPHESPD